MNKLLVYSLAALSVMAAMASCKEKPKSEDIITRKEVKKAPSAPERMQPYENAKTFNWGGKDYTSMIVRTACDSLEMVTNEDGQKFIDNTISLTITRSDGSKVFSKVFTKKDFDKQLDDDYRKTGILEGLVFDRVEDGKVRYAASVSHPQTDEYIPLVVMIDRMGHMTIDRDTQMDVSGQSEEEEEI